ncbi:MAG: hypothetical protein M1830_005300, partial [Pleopsidium flavum]
MNEKALLPMERSGMQKAKAANKEKSGKKVRLSKKGDDGFTATELMMIADGLEEARKRKAKEDEAAKLKKEADEQASLVRRRASEADRLARRRKLEEQIKTKTAVVVVQPLAKIKVEDPSRDDEASSALDRDRTPTQTATGRSRDRQLQNRTEQKRKAVAQGLFEAPKCDQDGLNMTPTADEDEAPISDDISSDDVVTLENELRLIKESVRKRTIQKQLLEAKAKERRVHAETSALERRAIEEDAEDNWILKRARSDEGNKQADEPKVGQRQISCVQEDADSYNVKLQSEGRKPPMTPEERKSSRRNLLESGTPRSTGSHQSQVSFTESEGESIDNSKEDLPMGLRAQGTSDLVPGDKAKSLKDNGNARTNEVKKLTEKQTQHGRYKIDPGPKKPAQMRNDGIHKQNMRSRAVTEENKTKLMTAIEGFQPSQASQACDREGIGGEGTYKIDKPQGQDSDQTVSSSDEDEEENQEIRNAQILRLSGPYQIQDEPAGAQPSQPRPTYARKTVPKELLTQVREEEQKHEIQAEDDISSIDGSDYQEERVNEMVWEYHVTRREWLNDEDPTEAEKTFYGPYWSKEQANNVAAIEVHQESGEVKIISPMDFNMTIDALGMQSYSISSKGGNISTAIDQSLIPPNRARGPMSKKSWLPPKMFVAFEKMSNKRAETEHNSDAVSIKVLGIFTMLDLANREASRCALEHRTPQLSGSQ